MELKFFLQELEKYPEIAFNPDYMVFNSEPRLYGPDKQLNHRLHISYQDIEKNFFAEHSQTDSSHVCSLFVAGASAMKEKLITYAQRQLPDGIYWDPEPEIKAILMTLKPNNDVCESILGLNDYLATAIPNLHQMSRSNLIQAKRNKTVCWLDQLAYDKRNDIVTLARKRRIEVEKSSQEAELERSKKRQKKMATEKRRRDALKERGQKEKERLSCLDLIVSCEDLKTTLSEIEEESISSTKKAQKKRKILREQIDIRKKVVNEKIKIPFTKNRKQRVLPEIIKDFLQYLREHSSTNLEGMSDSNFLVGKEIRHRFEVDGKEQWFSGVIVSYKIL